MDGLTFEYKLSSPIHLSVDQCAKFDSAINRLISGLRILSSYHKPGCTICFCVMCDILHSTLCVPPGQLHTWDTRGGKRIQDKGLLFGKKLVIFWVEVWVRAGAGVNVCVRPYRGRVGCYRGPLQYANPGRCHLRRQVEGCCSSVCACSGLRRTSPSIWTKVTSTTSFRPLKDVRKNPQVITSACVMNYLGTRVWHVGRNIGQNTFTVGKYFSFLEWM